MSKLSDEEGGHNHRKGWQIILLKHLKQVGSKVKYRFEHPEILKEFPLD